MLAPDPVKVTDWLIQMAELVVLADTVGKAIMVTVVAATLVLVQPAVLVPVTE